MKNNFQTSVYELFIATNNIKKKELAEYLDVSAAFVTQLVQGQRDIPNDKLALIKQNKDWDTSMFFEGDINHTEQKTENFSENNSGVSNVSGNGNRIKNEVTQAANIDHLLRTIDDKEEIIALLKEKNAILQDKAELQNEIIAAKSRDIKELTEQCAHLLGELTSKDK